MSITQLFFINLIVLFTLIIIDIIACRGTDKKTVYGVWINIYTNLTFLSVPCFIIYGIVVLF